MIDSTFHSQLEQINTSLQSIAQTLQRQSFLNSQLFAAIVGAVFGALVGLIPFLWSLYKDRAIVKVRAQTDWLVVPGAHPRKVLSIKIYNSGRRSINITHVFLQYATGDSLLFLTETAFIGASGLPFKLDEGNSHSVTISAGSIAESVHERADYPIAACFGDALGKTYKYKLPKKFWDNFFKQENPETDGHF